MDAQQPQQPQQPDFTLPALQGIVELMMAGAELSWEEAIEHLEQCWVQDNPLALETNLPTFDADATVSSNLLTQPAKYALKKIEAFKFMWYFLREGLQETVQIVRQLEENDTPAITQASKGNVMLCTANSLTTSKNAKPDHGLTFTECMYAKNHFLTCIKNVV
ncbi:hypothetical protein BKA82DRAFT_24962 [Pisolithus tinctorius]|uniref:Uncharacterized protein n=1 Tax=Pisolithus tinctorius Marx 270 TaxID=870435 RepID=A0A0C3NZG1_PISTI|nr:hypothetical protein BKA82DRAFT_24962 [Pisolithus tinctorius]KIO06235.1 hypothetical protein M404DRAFT_24962 [Pisolithus tinctorius Marx 270]